MRHRDKIAIVTGGTQGIGRGIVEKLRKEGAKVIVASRKPPVEPFTEDVQHYTVDVADEQAISEFFAAIEANYGQLDILVNNAGIMFQKHFLDTSVADWDRMMAINLRAVFMCCQYAAKLMVGKSKGGAIVNISSIEGIANNPDHVPYATTKSGILGLTRGIAVDMGQYGLRCNAVCPGWVKTPLNEDYFESLSDRQGALDAMQFLHPLKRLGTAADIANLVSWLASDEATWITGREFIVDGGRLVKLSNVNFEDFK